MEKNKFASKCELLSKHTQMLDINYFDTYVAPLSKVLTSAAWKTSMSKSATVTPSSHHIRVTRALPTKLFAEVGFRPQQIASTL